MHCEARLKTLVNKFSKDEKLLQEYNNIIKDQLKENVIERVSKNNVSCVGSTHYLPHRPVVRQDKITTKVRMVFDASSKNTGPSLNECLYPGPSLTESLYSLLLDLDQTVSLSLQILKKHFYKYR